jgi:hypothetical protein
MLVAKNLPSWFVTNQKQIDPIADLQKQIENAKFRLESMGVESNPDSRNWFEKATNLEEDQNWFFDALDLIDRPRQALTNFASSHMENQDNRDPLKALADGFAGRREVHGKDFLQNIDNPIARGALGFGIDVLSDPLTYTPAGVFKAGGKLLGTGAKAITPEPVKQLAGRGKEALGKTFNPTHGLERTLDGKQMDDLIDIRRKGIDAGRYYPDESLQNVTDAVKKAGGMDKGLDVGRHMEGVLTNAPEEIIKSSEMLKAGNQTLTQLAKEKGLGNLDTNEFYMGHVLSPQAKELVEKEGRTISTGRKGMGGDQRVISERYYDMPVEQANELIKQEKGIDFDWFETNAFKATAEKQRQTINYILAESAKREVLSNPNFARPLKDGEKLPKDFEVIDTNDYNFSLADDTVKVADGGQKYIVTKGAKKVLDQYKERLSDEGIRGFMEKYDKLHNTWKKFALFSVGFHARNFLGNNFNMWIAGVSPDDLVKYQTQAVKEIQQAKKGDTSKIYDEFKRQGLREGSVFENEIRFGDPQKALQRKVQTGAGARRTPFEMSRDIGTGADEFSRFALYKWAKEKGNNGKPMTDKKASAKVREVLFDYAELTPFEQGAKRVIPFYTWMRNNVPYQLANFALQPRKYAGVEKARQAGLEMTGMDDENLPDWLKESLAIPIQGDGEGNGNLLGFNLPASDLTQLSDPFGMVTNSITPLAKLPVELATNFDTFRGKHIEDFEGESGEVFGMDVGAKPAHAINQLLGSFGNISRRVGQEDQQDTLENILLGGMRKPVDMEQQQFFNTLEELQQLQDLIRKYKQDTGGALPTKRELEKQGNLFQFLGQ